MKLDIHGPFHDQQKVAKRAAITERRQKNYEERIRGWKAGGADIRFKPPDPKPSKLRCWYLRYQKPDRKGIIGWHKPYFSSEASALADKARIEEQYDKTGAEGLVLNQDHRADYAAARKAMADDTPLLTAVTFYRLHHPLTKKKNLFELRDEFLMHVRNVKLPPEEAVKTRHYSNVKSRLSMFLESPLASNGTDGDHETGTATASEERIVKEGTEIIKVGSTYPDAVITQTLLSYLRAISGTVRTRENHRDIINQFYRWLVLEGHATSNPASSITTKKLYDGAESSPRAEVRTLTLPFLVCYLRTLERYDPELLAHELIQLFVGIRSDQEASRFMGEWVDEELREVWIDKDAAKTRKAGLIEGAETIFWIWWAIYGVKSGLLRPKNFEPRWHRIRLLMTIEDPVLRDELARLPIKTLLKREDDWEKALKRWPWNGRRRSFGTYHWAKNGNQAKTIKSIRHAGSVYTFETSYKNPTIRHKDGVGYFSVQPEPVAKPIRPVPVIKGVVKLQANARALGANATAP